MFPNSGTNSLSANVPATLSINTPVAYTCTDPVFTIMNPPTSNQCDETGMFGPEATCVPRKLIYCYEL